MDGSAQGPLLGLCKCALLFFNDSHTKELELAAGEPKHASSAKGGSGTKIIAM